MSVQMKFNRVMLMFFFIKEFRKGVKGKLEYIGYGLLFRTMDTSDNNWSITSDAFISSFSNFSLTFNRIFCDKKKRRNKSVRGYRPILVRSEHRPKY